MTIPSQVMEQETKLL